MPDLKAEELRAAVPGMDGSVRLDGLAGEVEIFRDDLGIPHIRAGSVHDAFFAQGFAHAQDRLWQMDYDRRRAAGRWAEWAGPVWTDQDIFMRRLGLPQTAEADYAAFDPDTKAMFDAYAAGVNAFIATTPTLPVDQQADGPLIVDGVDRGPLRQSWYPYTILFNASGHPAMSVPAGFSAQGLPIGLQIFGRWHSEDRLLAFAAALETMKPWAHHWPAAAGVGRH